MSLAGFEPAISQYLLGTNISSQTEAGYPIQTRLQALYFIRIIKIIIDGV